MFIIIVIIYFFANLHQKVFFTFLPDIAHSKFDTQFSKPIVYLFDTVSLKKRLFAKFILIKTFERYFSTESAFFICKYLLIFSCILQ